MPAIGYVTRQEDGSFKGQLRTLSIRADIEIVPNRTKNTESQPDYRIVNQWHRLCGGRRYAECRSVMVGFSGNSVLRYCA